MDWARDWSLVQLAAYSQRGEDLRQDLVAQRVAHFQFIETFGRQILGVWSNFQVGLQTGEQPVERKIHFDIETI